MMARLTVLCEDTSGDPRLHAEHGLALLVEAGEYCVLLDTGASGAFLRNAEHLGVDLRDIDAVVLSHGHYDHTGGLAPLLESIGPRTVVAHPAVFRHRYSVPPARPQREIGPPLSKSGYERLGAHFRLAASPWRWDNSVLTTGGIPDAFSDRRPGHLNAQIGDAIVPDDFADDTSLVVPLPPGACLVTGCAHAGLRNIVHHVREITPEAPIRSIVGGTHLVAYSSSEIRQIARFLADAGVQAIAPCHCTGARAVRELERHFPGTVTPLTTGDVVEVDGHGGLAVRS